MKNGDGFVKGEAFEGLVETMSMTRRLDVTSLLFLRGVRGSGLSIGKYRFHSDNPGDHVLAHQVAAFWPTTFQGYFHALSFRQRSAKSVQEHVMVCLTLARRS